MIKEKSTKEYILNHWNSLYESLWTSIETRKNSSIDERKKIVNSGWIEEEMERIIADFQLLMQIEVNRLLETLLVVQNFFSFFEKRPMSDFIEHLIIDPFEGKAGETDGFERMKKVFEASEELINKAVEHVQKSILSFKI